MKALNHSIFLKLGSAMLLLQLLVFGACASGPSRRPHIPLQTGKPISHESFLAARRAFHRMPAGDTLRPSLRSRLIGYLGDKTAALIDADNYDGMVEQLGLMTDLYSPEELAEVSLSPALGPVARFVAKEGEARGDEARVLSALWILAKLNPDPALGYAKHYRQVAAWGRDARSSLDIFEHYQGLLEIWEEHVRLTPAPRVQRQLIKLYFQRRDALADMVANLKNNPKKAPQISFQDFNLARFVLRRTPVDLSAVFLAEGEVHKAYDVLKRYKTSSEAEKQLLYLIDVAMGKSDSAPDAMLTLARLYLREVGRPDVATGLCRYGIQEYEEDARFALCLARIAATQNEYADATANYAEAIRLANQERGVYDEALQVLQRLIEARLFESNPSETRALTKEAEHILKERMQRWPKLPPPVDPSQFHFAVGTAEMSAGNTEQAEKRFLMSYKASPNVSAMLRLGLLSLNRGVFEKAIEQYSTALDLARKLPRGRLRAEAESLERLGDAYRMLGREAESKQRYKQAAELWHDASGSLDENELASAYVRRGVLADRLGLSKESVDFFRLAMEYAAAERDVYEQILAHLVTSGGSVELAHEVFGQALTQVSLEPEWKVYFALWVQVIAARAGEEVQSEVTEELNKLADNDAWWSRLASFGIGKVPYAQLLAEANGRGEQTEAHFYEGTRLLHEGKVASAKVLFKRVLSTDMVSFYEYAMAREFLTQPDKLQPNP
ncbi:MAG: tetratricopeptide repeat protein [Myxococcales bacterium]|nr:MAG: tetratricopeptide repeat protein [Myxococcales bacterium]